MNGTNNYSGPGLNQKRFYG
jgi:hypothetical protein